MVQGRFHLSCRSGERIQRLPFHTGATRGNARRRGCLRTIRRASCQDPSGTISVRGTKSGWVGGKKRFSSPSGGNSNAIGSAKASEKSRSSSPGCIRSAFCRHSSAINPVPLARRASLGWRRRITCTEGQGARAKEWQMQLAGGRLQMSHRSVRNPRDLWGESE